MAMWKKKIKAFTLIEALVTLGICSGILLIGSLQLKNYHNRLIFDNTVKEVAASLDQASRVSTISNKAVLVMFSKENHYLKLMGEDFNKQVNIDPGIDITGLNKFRFNSSGYSSPGTVTFKGYGIKRNVKYQMLWGRMTE